jgi:hypothetical protein
MILMRYMWPYAPAAPAILVGTFFAAAMMECFHLLDISQETSASSISMISVLVIAFLAAFRVAIDDAGTMICYFLA